MIRIAITWPDFFEGESDKIVSLLLEDRFDKVHIRKPTASGEAISRLLAVIPDEYHPRIVLHDHFELIEQFPHIGGFHLNHRNPYPPAIRHEKKPISRSCHTLEEVVRYKPECDYVFLSPIFDSISKQGYQSAFSSEVLKQAADTGIIDDKVISLGGVTEEKIPLLTQWHFGGYAMLGNIWKENIDR